MKKSRFVYGEDDTLVIEEEKEKGAFIISQIESQLALNPEGGWVEMGGPGSGNWGHKGRKGKRGGSAPGGGGGIRREQIGSTTVAWVGDVATIGFTYGEQKVIRDTLAKVPSGHRDMVVKITKSSGLGKDVRGKAHPHGHIDLSSGGWGEETLLHEVGHLVGYKGKHFGAFGRIFTRGLPRAGMFNVTEIFSHSYADYIIRPTSLRSVNPNIYDYMRDKVFAE